jgi:hypothetical protein
MKKSKQEKSLIDLRSDDDHFDAQWGCNDHKQQEKSFYEWCSLYDDLKHIKQKEVV